MEPTYTQRAGIPLQTRPVPGFFDPAELQNLKSIVPHKGNEMEIVIDDHFTAKRYQPGSVVKGVVNIKPKKQLKFGSVSINFVCESGVEKPNGNLPLEKWHRLLELDMPIAQEALPKSKLLMPNQIYTIPFYFVLPQSLGTASCAHQISFEEIRHLHSELPPSIMGWERDAMIPRGARIEYGVIAQVLGLGAPGYAKLGSKQTIQFWPRCLQQASFDPLLESHIYQFESSKQLKNAFFSRAVGQMTLSANQPEALVLDSNGVDFQPIVVLMHLCFQPFDAKSSLPQSCIVSAELESQTWSYENPMEHLPYLNDQRDAYNNTDVILKKLDSQLSWEPDIVEDRQIRPTFRSRLEIPIQKSATNRRIYLPTFYSCIIARTYRLKINVQVAAVNLKLVLPIQLTTGKKAEGVHNEDLSISLDGHPPEYSDLIP